MRLQSKEWYHSNILNKKLTENKMENWIIENALLKAIGLLQNIKSEIDYLPDGYYDWINEIVHYYECIDDRLWIDVTDSTPKDSCLVLGVMKDTNDQYICFYKKSINTFIVYGAGRDPITDMKVTHWTNLPEPPVK